MPATAETTLQFFWQDRSVPAHFRSGVSLHSHTMYSEESLNMVPRYTASVPFLGRVIRAQQAEYSAKTGRGFDFADAFWTPPLAPRQAYRIEEKQIQRQFQLPGFVSLTDHDDIRAATLLRVMDRFRRTPVSTEWTIPYGPTFFHLGVHNIPASQAAAYMQRFRSFTADPGPAALSALLNALQAHPDVLLVLNHPLWDEKGIGAAHHLDALTHLLACHGKSFHALEVNGLRSWHENRRVLALAREINLPAVSGGDRHGREPNTILNLSPAGSLVEFIHEVRYRRSSHVVFMPQYREPLKMRVLQTMVDVVRTYPENIEGRRLWGDRIFHRDPVSGQLSALSALWSDGGPRIVKHFITAMALLEWSGVRSALRLALDDGSVVGPDPKREAAF